MAAAAETGSAAGADAATPMHAQLGQAGALAMLLTAASTLLSHATAEPQPSPAAAVQLYTAVVPAAAAIGNACQTLAWAALQPAQDVWDRLAAMCAAAAAQLQRSSSQPAELTAACAQVIDSRYVVPVLLTMLWPGLADLTRALAFSRVLPSPV